MLFTGDPSRLRYSGAHMVRDGNPGPGRGLSGCAWCGASYGATAVRLAGRTRCDACGAATTDPWPTPDELELAYSRYRPESGRFSGIGDAVLRRTRARLAGRIDRLAPPGGVLDVGSGDGALLDALSAHGREALGLERRSHRADVRDTDVTDVEGQWSAVVFWHSLEHLPSPGDSIDHAARLIGPGGALLVAVPNADSFQARVFGDRWFHLDVPRHLVHLPAAALVERLRSLGLTVTRISHWRGGQALFGWLHGLVGTIPGRPDLYDAIRRPEARSQPMGARRRALTLCAATALFPLASLTTAVEIAARRGGTIYVEAHRG